MTSGILLRPLGLSEVGDGSDETWVNTAAQDSSDWGEIDLRNVDLTKQSVVVYLRSFHDFAGTGGTEVWWTPTVNGIPLEHGPFIDQHEMLTSETVLTDWLALSGFNPPYDWIERLGVFVHDTAGSPGSFAAVSVVDWWVVVSTPCGVPITIDIPSGEMNNFLEGVIVTPGGFDGSSTVFTSEYGSMTQPGDGRYADFVAHGYLGTGQSLITGFNFREFLPGAVITNVDIALLARLEEGDYDHDPDALGPRLQAAVYTRNAAGTLTAGPTVGVFDVTNTEYQEFTFPAVWPTPAMFLDPYIDTIIDDEQGWYRPDYPCLYIGRFDDVYENTIRVDYAAWRVTYTVPCVDLRPICRIFPRDDDRGPSPRIYPPPRAAASRGRITGYQ